MDCKLYDKNKVILFYPAKYLRGNKPDFPLSLLALTGPLFDAGFEPVIIDARVEIWEKRFKEEINNRVLFVGISALTSDMIHYGIKASRWVKKYNPQIPVVWGGMHASLLPEQTLKTGEFIDIVVRGEGDDIVVNLARALKDNIPLEEIGGISFKISGNIISNSDPLERVSLEKLKVPPYDMLNLGKYTSHNFLYMSARGCPYSCKFCEVISFHHHKYSAKSVGQVLDELKYIVHKYKPENIEFVDEDFFINTSRSFEICDGIINRGLNFTWFAACRADHFRYTDGEYWKTVKNSGAKHIYVGAESGSDIVLQKIKKQITVSDIYHAAEQLTKLGINMSCNFIIGFPEETEEDIKATIALAKELELKYGERGLIVGGVNIYAPYPGSEMYYEIQKYGFKPPAKLKDWGNMILNDLTMSKWNHKIKYFHRVSVVCRWKGVHSLKEGIKKIYNEKSWRDKLKQLIKVIFRYLATKRWSKMNFKYPLDIKLAYLISKYITKYG